MAKKDTKSSTYLHEGIISVSSRGAGYVPTTAFEQDIEIRHEDMNTALHGDTVQVRMKPLVTGERPTGVVTEILNRKKTRFVGTVEYDRGLCFVIPDDRRVYIDILIPHATAKDYPEGTKVQVVLAEWTDPRKNPEGKVVDVIGKKGEHETEMHAIVLEHGFETEFPPSVVAETDMLELGITHAEIERRRDMRGVKCFTIDPLTAKDFDDALSIRTLDSGDIEVGIHIADVSHYVHPETELDREAQSRGTSIYLVDRTIPMLPERLSNEMCSLNPNEDRLAFSAVFTFSKKDFAIVDRWFGETVIHSNKRFTYESAQQLLDSKKGLLYEELKQLDDIAHVVRDRRIKIGAVDFDQDEVDFELDSNGKPTRIFKKDRLNTMKLIEEFMLLANREVAEHIYKTCKANGKDLVFVYRIHDVPDPDRLEELGIFLRAIGHELESDGDEGISARDINKLFKEIKGTPEENLIKTATIRSMAKAIYSTKNIGHFGLAFKYYTHFTSPIRRYPDVMVHRIMKQFLAGKPINNKAFGHYERLAVQSSEREMQAVQAERDSIKYKQVEYMSDFVGQTFKGVITGVTDWGIFVEETETKAEGMVRLSNLGNDYYTLDRKKYALIGKSTKHTYTLGDAVDIKVTGTDLEAKTIDYVFV